MGDNMLANAFRPVFNPAWMFVISKPNAAAPVPCLWLAVCALLFCAVLSRAANDPGGGSPGVGPSVTLSDSGSYITLNNGTISARITKANAHVTSLLFRGREMVKSGGDIYFSMDGGSSYEQPGNCVYKVHRSSQDMMDISLKTYGTNRIHKFDIDIHYVLRRGDSGLYGYAILDHPAHYPATSVGEWRMVWKMEQDPLERIYVDDIRQWQKPSAYDLANAEATPIAEIVKLTTGPWAGRYDCKYMYSVEYEKFGAFGHASNRNKVGAWAVFGGFDYFNDGPTKQDLAPASGIIHIHFGRNHYNGSSTSISTNEPWSKIYGPWLLYCNTNSVGADACWADAKAQAKAEQAAWPYTWLTGIPQYPPAGLRGAVQGALRVRDLLKPQLSASNAWVGLAQPAPGGHWQFDSKSYQYWARTDAGGNFTIPNVRPGSYQLTAFTDGAVGEFVTNGITVTAGATNRLGRLTWAVPHRGNVLAWEIGIPNRTAAEFRHGTDYWEPYIWETFPAVLPNPLNYKIGQSNWTNDWNFAHGGYKVGSTYTSWPWRVHFMLTNVPTSGNATLTLAWAGAHYARMQIFVNSSTQFGPNLYPSAYGGPTGGNALLRQGVHAKYGVDYVTIPVSLLRQGSNTITLLQGRSDAPSDHVMYDYLSLELPGTLPLGNVRLAPVSITGHEATLSVLSVPGYSYQLQRAGSASLNAWQNVGQSQAGTGDDLLFRDNQTNPTNALYRVRVVPQP